jgi:hypothetical protein
MIGAIINQTTNIVENVVILGEGKWSPPDGFFCIDVTDLEPQPGIGWSYIPSTQQFSFPCVEPVTPSEGPTVI